MSKVQFAGRRRRAMSRRLAIFAVFLLAGCADKRGGPIPYNVESFGTPDAPKVVPLEQNYRIAPLDTLSIKVFKMPDLTGDYEVDLAGQISMPLIGEMSARRPDHRPAGPAPDRKLGEKYLENPDVSVGIKSSTRRSVTVDGSVNKSGSYPVNGPTTPDPGGRRRRRDVRRTPIRAASRFSGQIGGQRQAAAFDLTSIRRGEAPDPQVYAGDIVVVDGSAIKAAQRQILNSLADPVDLPAVLKQRGMR